METTIATAGDCSIRLAARRKLLAALLLILMPAVLLAGCQVQSSIQFRGVEYHPVERQGGVSIYQSSNGVILQVERGDDGARIEHAGVVYQVSGTYNQADYAFPDGRVLTRRIVGQSIEGFAPFEVDITINDWDIVDDLQAIAFGPSASGSTGPTATNIIFGVIAAAIGVLQVTQPQAAFFLAKGWKYRSLEPSDAFLLVTRMSGSVFVLVGILLITGVIR
jgi:hypothetical protein